MSGFRSCIGLFALCCALPVFGLPPKTEHASALLQHLQEPVQNIESANRINDWEQLDDQHLVLRLGPQDRYLITLKNRCVGLSWARNVGVTMSDNTIWAGFDAITVDGNQCEIETINPVGSP